MLMKSTKKVYVDFHSSFLCLKTESSLLKTTFMINIKEGISHFSHFSEFDILFENFDELRFLVIEIFEFYHFLPLVIIISQDKID